MIAQICFKEYDYDLILYLEKEYIKWIFTYKLMVSISIILVNFIL